MPSPLSSFHSPMKGEAMHRITFYKYTELIFFRAGRIKK